MSDFREDFAKAKHIVVLTGAGVSAESGVPTFRGAGGYWRKWQAQVYFVLFHKIFHHYFIFFNIYNDEIMGLLGLTGSRTMKKNRIYWDRMPHQKVIYFQNCLKLHNLNVN
jgi:NAD-dependent SIR2 family protein deacetylase